MSHDALLARLARLDSQDRAWLLGELPPRMRNELLGLLADEVAPPAAKVEPALGLESLEPEQVAHLMDAEPPWLVSAVTRRAEPRWRARLLAAMASRRRHEIELADRTGAPLSAHAARLAFEQCRTRIGNPAPREPDAAPRSRFAGMVDSMRGRFA